MYFSPFLEQNLKSLSEYYKFHSDVPRFFIHKIDKIIHNFYDKKRRINYILVTKMLSGKVDHNFKIHDSDNTEFHSRIHSSMLHIIPKEFKTTWKKSIPGTSGTLKQLFDDLKCVASDGNFHKKKIDESLNLDH